MAIAKVLEESPGVVAPARAAPAMRGVNRSIRSVSSAVDPGELVAFLCECADTTCFAVSWLTVGAFDACEQRGGWILVEGHEAADASWWSDSAGTSTGARV